MNDFKTSKENFIKRINKPNLFSDNDIDNYINEMRINDYQNNNYY